MPPQGTAFSARGIEPPLGREGYEAFGTKDKVARLRIHCTAAPSNSPNYSILYNIKFDHQGTNFILMYPSMLVLVRGKNLQKIVFAIENSMADFIQQFDPERWSRPTDASAAVIDTIEVLENKGGMPGSETQH